MADVHGPNAPAERRPADGRRPAESPSCPLLGLPDDPTSRYSFPSVGHRCRAGNRLRPIELGHQGAFCLAATYPECRRYQAAAASAGPAAAPPPTSGVSLERVRTAAGGPGGAGTPGPGGAGEAGRQPPGRTRRRGRVVAIVLVGAVLAGAAWLGGPAIVDWMRHVGAGAGAASGSPSTPPPATLAPTATPASTATPTPAVTPTLTATPLPTARPTPTATVTPAATPLVYVVVHGDNLSAIAARYGVSIAAIVKANGITDPGVIVVGQRLVIPRR